MPRTSRAISETEIHHVILRGVNKQLVFMEEGDRRFFLKRMSEYQVAYEMELHAYCLMDNHIHLLIKCSSEVLGKFMGRLGTSHARYFNKKYDRVGHLFQGRYKSLPVESDEYYLSVFRYIHQNPEQAGFKRFAWTSYDEYETLRPKITAIGFALSLFTSHQELLDYLCDHNSNDSMEVSVKERVSDSEAIGKMRRIIGASDVEVIRGINDVFEIAYLHRDDRTAILRRFKNAGLTIRQIEQATGIGRGIITRA